MHCLFCVESSNQKLLEKQGVSFFFLFTNTFSTYLFYPKHLENILNILINISTTLKKKPKNPT
jgi:plasmid rolling circle replication initiator protein Rep